MSEGPNRSAYADTQHKAAAARHLLRADGLQRPSP